MKHYLRTERCGAYVTADVDGRYVTLNIGGQEFTVRDLKELRKFLKGIQRELEQADLANIVV